MQRPKLIAPACGTRLQPERNGPSLLLRKKSIVIPAPKIAKAEVEGSGIATNWN
jgi:hypothetical protein